MNIGKIIQVKWHILKRSKLFYILITFNYFVLAFFDPKSAVLLPGVEQYIYRYNNQQFYIVLTSIFIVNILFNEKSLNSIKNYFVIYIKDVKTDIFGTFWIICISNIVAFSIGQSTLLLINFLYFQVVYLSLFFVNLAVVSMEIIICTLLVMSLRLLFKKDIFIIGIFIIIIFTSIAVNNVYISIPLTIKILEGEAYYLTYGMDLWLGRIFLLCSSFVIFIIGLKKFDNMLVKQ